MRPHSATSGSVLTMGITAWVHSMLAVGWEKSWYQMDVAPWCYKWGGLDGVELVEGWCIKHFRVLIKHFSVLIKHLRVLKIICYFYFNCFYFHHRKTWWTRTVEPQAFSPLRSSSPSCPSLLPSSPLPSWFRCGSCVWKQFNTSIGHIQPWFMTVQPFWQGQ